MWNSLGTELCNKPEDENLRPWFYTWSLMCRYFPTGTSIVTSKISENSRLRVVTGIAGNQLSVAILNNTDQEQDVSLKGDGLPETRQWAKYHITDENASLIKMVSPFPVERLKGSFSEGLQLSIPAQSFVLLTNMKR